MNLRSMLVNIPYMVPFFGYAFSWLKSQFFHGNPLAVGACTLDLAKSRLSVFSVPRLPQQPLGLFDAFCFPSCEQGEIFHPQRRSNWFTHTKNIHLAKPSGICPKMNQSSDRRWPKRRLCNICGEWFLFWIMTCIFEGQPPQNKGHLGSRYVDERTQENHLKGFWKMFVVVASFPGGWFEMLLQLSTAHDSHLSSRNLVPQIRSFCLLERHEKKNSADEKISWITEPKMAHPRVFEPTKTMVTPHPNLGWICFFLFLP